jgi:predicted Zn-ribbon and HTH transcriptional regulator
MKSFIAMNTVLFVLSFSAMGQEMKSRKHNMDSTNVEKTMSQKQHKDAAKIVQYTCPMHPEIITTKPGKCPKCGMTLVNAASHKVKGESKKANALKAEVYTCPMHPDVKSDKPGKCPKCKMELVKATKDK